MPRYCTTMRVATLAFCLLSLCGRSRGALPVTNGVLLWLDATDSTTLFQDPAMTIPALAGDPVGGWMDKSGNGFHATQTSMTRKPALEAAAMNGLPAVRLDGSQRDGMTIDPSLTLTRPYTAFIVNQYYGDIRGRTLQGRDSNWLHGLWSGRISSYAEGFISANVPADVNVPYVADTTGDVFGDSTFFVNGADMTVNPNPSGEPGRLGLGTVGAFPAEASDADISEIVIYDRILNQDELTQMRSFLYTKYNVEEIEFELVPQNTVRAGSIGTFAGGDPGDGLDFEGNFAYAINVGGPGDVTVGDATFTDGSEAGMAGGTSPGASITDANEILDWHPAADYGDTANDDELEFVMESIRWNVPPGLEIDLDVEPGTQYKLQLLFAESCCDRGFDIFVEDQLMVDNINVQVLQEGINNGSQGVFFTHTLAAADDVLNIVLGGDNPWAPDNNPILNGLTLEIVGGVPPGDFNNNGTLDAGDIDTLSAEVRSGQNRTTFDLNNDAVVDRKDRTVWVEQLKRTYFGDANLDGEFNSGDFVQVFQRGEYEDTIAGNSTWEDGDWDGDGEFDSTDFVVAFQGGGFEQGPRAGAAAVPEPQVMLLLIPTGLAFSRVIRHARYTKHARYTTDWPVGLTRRTTTSTK